MKKLVNKNTLFGFLMGIVVTGSIGVLAANYLYESTEISYKPSDSSWDVKNVQAALDNLYSLLSKGDATATAEDIAEGKTAYIDGELVTGTMKSNDGNYDIGLSMIVGNSGGTKTSSWGRIGSFSINNGNVVVTYSANNSISHNGSWCDPTGITIKRVN